MRSVPQRGLVAQEGGGIISQKKMFSPDHIFFFKNRVSLFLSVDKSCNNSGQGYFIVMQFEPIGPFPVDLKVPVLVC